ncbi:hypothetical protein D3C87_776830 [compost metagenome]
MQHTGIDVTEHAVRQTIAVQQGTKLGDVVGQFLRRHGGIFNERLRANLTFDVAQQPDRAFAHDVDAGHGFGAFRQRVAQPLNRRVGLQMRHERRHARVHLHHVVTAELHQIDAQRRALDVRREILGDAMPDDVFHRQQQHPGVHGFDGQRLVRQ